MRCAEEGEGTEGSAPCLYAAVNTLGKPNNLSIKEKAFLRPDLLTCGPDGTICVEGKIVQATIFLVTSVQGKQETTSMLACFDIFRQNEAIVILAL